MLRVFYWVLITLGLLNATLVITHLVEGDAEGAVISGVISALDIILAAAIGGCDDGT